MSSVATVQEGEEMKHFLWLIKQMVKHFYNGDVGALCEAWMLLKIHCKYAGKQIRSSHE